MQPMKVFDFRVFLGRCIDAVQARWMAEIADKTLEKQSFVLYGRFVNGEYVDFSSVKKPGDTHCILCYAQKQMVMPIEEYESA